MSIKGKRIFIVEDNISNRVVYQMCLLVHGADVQFERHGRDAVQRLQSSGPLDLIILDLMLQGGLSGYDLFEAIRTLPDYERTPIIAVSAADVSTAIPKTQAMGFNGFIAKPIDDYAFPRQIARIMEGEGVWSASSAFEP